MKKFLTMLVLIALVSAFAFAADGKAAIIVKLTVGAVSPSIQLHYSGEIADENTDGIDIGFSIKDGGKVLFQAMLMSPSNTHEVYSISFGGGTFNDVVRRGAIGTRSPNSIKTEAGNASDISGINSISLGESTGIGGDENKVVLVAFDGGVGNDVNFPVTLASAEYEYAEDSSIDSGVYYADVTMTVAAL